MKVSCPDGPRVGAFLSGKSTAILPAAYYAELKLEAVFLPASRQCQHGSNKGKYYTCFDKAHEARHNNWTLACTLAMIYLLPAEHRSAPRSASSVQTATARLPPPRAPNVLHVYARSARCAAARSSWFVTSHCGIHETRPTVLSTSTRQILDAGLADPAAAAFPAPRCYQRELPHQRLARQQEAAARLAALTPLLLSPSIGQAELMPNRHPIRHPNPFSYGSIQITSHSAFDAPAYVRQFMHTAPPAGGIAIEIGAAVVAVIALMAVLILVRYRNTHNKRTPPPPLRAVGKKDPWYPYRYIPRPPPPQSRGPFMPMGTPAPPLTKIGTDSVATLTHPDDQQRFAYGYAPEHQRFEHDWRQPEGGEEHDEVLAVRNSACVPSPYCSAALYGTRNIAPCTLAGAPFRCDPTLPDNIAGGAIKLTPRTTYRAFSLYPVRTDHESVGTGGTGTAGITIVGRLMKHHGA
ncbi:hypothetical protein B0H14DRAFT_3471170 [Mycena olivaceomarginata]|nr:hypothetical protein B0H14DRAFT_3471170 [Mycena olivaceomarginata]